MMRSRLIAARPLARTIRWPALIASFAPALWFVWQTSSSPDGNVGASAIALRLGAVSLAIGAAFVLEDPTEGLTAPAPVSLLARRALRVALALSFLVPAWLILIAIANGASYLAAPLPAGWLLVEMAALSCVGLAGAALGARRLADGLGGPAGSGAVVMTAAVVAVLPWGASLLSVAPGSPDYPDNRRWWWVLLVAAAAVFVAASRTPGGVRRRPYVWRSSAGKRR